MNSNSYNLDLEDLNQTGANIGMSHDSLPFPCPVFYVINGQAAYQNNPVKSLFYGGWAVDSAKYQGVLAQTQRKPHTLLQPASVSSRGGKNIDIFTSRLLLVSPAATRTAWLSKDNKTRYPDYQDGTRRHVQLLCVLADKGPSGYIQWGPAVLSAKGFQAKKLLGFLDDWSKHTVEARTKFAAGVPAFMFYMGVGTSSAQREVEMVGSGSQTSPITPMSVYKPTITAEVLEKLYGGDALLQEIKRLQAAAASWVSGWDKESSAGGNSPAMDGDHHDNNFPTEDVEIPF